VSRLRSWHAVAFGMGVGIPLGAVAGAVLGLLALFEVPGIRPDERVGAFALLGGVAAFFAAGLVYLPWLMMDIAGLSLPESDLLPGERPVPGGVWVANHRHRGWPQRLQGMTGGKLFLTDRRLVYRAHGGQPWNYELSIPLEEIEEARGVGGLLGQLQVERADGSEERFNLGPVANVEARAAEILDARDAAEDRA
jgi:hypothetical protein